MKMNKENSKHCIDIANSAYKEYNVSRYPIVHVGTRECLFYT